MMTGGRATPEATRRHADRHPDLPFTDRGPGGTTVSRIGFGGYRVGLTEPAHRQALEKTLLSGVNLVDTSSNYKQGASEVMIGRVLGDLIGRAGLRREAVLVVTKGGYLQGHDYALSLERRDRGRPYPDLVPLDQGYQHCIHPEFLADQIHRSREDLGLEVLDAYLLHNPEHYLSWAQKQGLAPEAARDTYYARLDVAMRFLESQADRGLIGCWGLSSNTLALPADEYEFTSLERLWNMAEAISPGHRFRVVQTPLNLLEPRTATERNQSGGQTVLDFAERHGLTLLAARPLNAIVGDRLIRLADADPVEPPAVAEIEALLDRVVRVEKRFEEVLIPPLGLPPATVERLSQRASLGRSLLDYWTHFKTLAQYQSIRNNVILPRLNDFLDYLVTIESSGDAFSDWMRDYLDGLQPALEAIETRYRAERSIRSRLIGERVAALDSGWAAAGGLSRMALRAVRTTSGVTSVLVGMRRPEYVDDMLTEFSQPAGEDRLSPAWSRLEKLIRNLPR
ncbi:MAG: aldo/keto reductase [Proteobacteria bacterium]|nr:aldo/keto reductase [Pseudomonadota bacterium]